MELFCLPAISSQVQLNLKNSYPRQFNQMTTIDELQLLNANLTSLLTSHIANQKIRDENYDEQIGHLKILVKSQEQRIKDLCKLPSSSSSNSFSDSDSDSDSSSPSTKKNKWEPIVDDLIEFRSSSHKSNEHHVKRIFKHHKLVLQPLVSLCPQIRPLLTAILTNQQTITGSFSNVAGSLSNVRVPRRTSPLSQTSKKKIQPLSIPSTLKTLSKDEATALGRGFRKHLLRNKEIETAGELAKLAYFVRPTTNTSLKIIRLSLVDAYRLDHEILQPLFNENLSFRPILEAIARSLIVSSIAGLAKRVAVGAVLSITDMASDVAVTVSYIRGRNLSGAYSLIAMISTSISFQLFTVLALHRKKTSRAILREVGFVVSFVKPAVDAYRVATGSKDDKSVLPPLTEMSVMKSLELAAESIPGGLLQTYIFLNAPEKTIFHMISILISTLTTGFSSAMISYDMDVSTNNR